MIHNVARTSHRDLSILLGFVGLSSHWSLFPDSPPTEISELIQVLLTQYTERVELPGVDGGSVIPIAA